ncbi:hypothetical protein J6590_023029 [Homalodisca vitripennis]|nr:hypothetical protein J6590_023029 [Homalodisca vitripennis]
MQRESRVQISFFIAASSRCLYSEAAVLTSKVRTYCLHRSGLVFTEQDCASVYTRGCRIDEQVKTYCLHRSGLRQCLYPETAVLTSKVRTIVYIGAGWSLLSKIAPVSILRGCRIDEQSQNILLHRAGWSLLSKIAPVSIPRDCRIDEQSQNLLSTSDGLVFTEQDCASVYTPRLPY